MKTDTYIFENDITVFCKKAESFPDKVKEAFKYIHSLAPFDDRRMQLGLSKILPNGDLAYWAGCTEHIKGEFEAFDLEKIIIPKGAYVFLQVQNYMDDITTIGEAFKMLMAQEPVEADPMGIEWYVSMQEVYCMLKKP